MARRASDGPGGKPYLLAFNKPFGVICQFSAAPGRKTLADFVSVPAIYPAGRLDTDSEGLLLLTADGQLQHRISAPGHKLQKGYWVQVEGQPDVGSLARLEAGVDLGDFTTRPCQARLIDEPAALWQRTPPIRRRASIPTSWLSIALTEGKNRQIRRMTAKVGFPTLRLIRHQIGPWSVGMLSPGQSQPVDAGLLMPGRHQPRPAPSR